MTWKLAPGTFHPATTLRSLGAGTLEVRLCAAVAPPHRRPLWREPQSATALLSVSGADEAVADNCRSFISAAWQAIGIDPLEHDIRFVEDDWESPTLGAWGLGWEVWCDGMEVTQYTYFQQVGGYDCKPVPGELTYGLERLAMYIQGVDHFRDIVWNEAGVTYGDVYGQAEREFSAFNFDHADTTGAVPAFRRCRNGLCPSGRAEAAPAGL